MTESVICIGCAILSAPSIVFLQLRANVCGLSIEVVIQPSPSSSVEIQSSGKSRQAAEDQVSKKLIFVRQTSPRFHFGLPSQTQFHRLCAIHPPVPRRNVPIRYCNIQALEDSSDRDVDTVDDPAHIPVSLAILKLPSVYRIETGLVV
jgi:hypothetical protein